MFRILMIITISPKTLQTKLLEKYGYIPKFLQHTFLCDFKWRVTQKRSDNKYLTRNPKTYDKYFRLLSKCIKTSEVVAYEDLGTEAIHKLTVKDFPVIVVIDCEGENLYEKNIINGI